MNIDTVEKMTISTDCEWCEVEIEVVADYSPAFDSIEYTCPKCGEEAGVSNWMGCEQL